MTRCGLTELLLEAVVTRKKDSLLQSTDYPVLKKQLIEMKSHPKSLRLQKEIRVASKSPRKILYSVKLGLAVSIEEMDAVGDRTQVSNLITMGVLRRETQAGTTGDMTKLHGN